MIKIHKNEKLSVHFQCYYTIIKVWVSQLFGSSFWIFLGLRPKFQENHEEGRLRLQFYVFYTIYHSHLYIFSSKKNGLANMQDLNFPKLIHGSSSLGNLFKVVEYKTKVEIVQKMIESSPDGRIVIDTAGKYGAGLALEAIGQALKELKVAPENVIISNKLGWIRVPLTTPEPTFEKGAWMGIDNDAVQNISYEGILTCYEQGNELLGDYNTSLASVHDPDEYLDAATDPEDRARRMEDIKGAYRALFELKAQGKVKGVGVGSKQWRIIKELYDGGIKFDWVMFANSYTIYNKPAEVVEFINSLASDGVFVINSAVFQAGFLTGGSFFDYVAVTRESRPELFEWRDTFFRICQEHKQDPALVAVQYVLKLPAISSIALSSSRPSRVVSNGTLITGVVPDEVWAALAEAGIIDPIA